MIKSPVQYSRCARIELKNSASPQTGLVNAKN
nr:MAG TPA: hypothetical protein [Caudoviricetes sp.]